MDGKNKLYSGGNVKILRDYVASQSVDLIHLDPTIRLKHSQALVITFLCVKVR